VVIEDGASGAVFFCFPAIYLANSTVYHLDLIFAVLAH